MQFPASFQAQRSALESLCNQVSLISLHSYETASAVSSAAGAVLLADAVQDTSRRFRPEAWNAVILYAMADKQDSLSSRLSAINEHCPLKTFVEAQRFADSLAVIEQEKMKRSTGQEQSIEWQVMGDCRAVPALAAAYHDASLALVDDEGKSLVTDIDSALSELTTLKADRHSRLTETVFTPAGLNIDVVSLNAGSARSLADSIKSLGDNNMHWVYCAFVGSEEELKPVKELFL